MGDAELNKKQPIGQICFNCRFCGKQICVPSVHAGKKGKCPQCKNIILVPQEKDPPPKPDLELQLQPIPAKNSILDDQSKDRQYEMLRQSAGFDSSQPLPQRKLPWLIDVFLYPANIHGLYFLVIAALIPLAMQIAVAFLVSLIGMLAILAVFINFFIDIIILMFAFWFLAECICDSAAGNLRAPNIADRTPGLAEMGLRLLRIFFCLAAYLLPAAVYYKYTSRTDAYFHIIAGCGIFLYPMALLGILMFDSVRGMSPHIVVPSLFSALIQYCALIAFVYGIIYLFVKARESLLDYFFVWLFLRATEAYLLMVLSHLLGRFYFKYQEKLNWEV